MSQRLRPPQCLRRSLLLARRCDRLDQDGDLARVVDDAAHALAGLPGAFDALAHDAHALTDLTDRRVGLGADRVDRLGDLL